MPAKSYSVGIDIISIHRVEKLLKKSRKSSFGKYLSVQEQAQSPKNFRKLSVYWAKIWAAKEAFFKANHLIFGLDALSEWTVLFKKKNQFSVMPAKSRLNGPQLVSGSFFQAGHLVGAQVICL